MSAPKRASVTTHVASTSRGPVETVTRAAACDAVAEALGDALGVADALARAAAFSPG